MGCKAESRKNAHRTSKPLMQIDYRVLPPLSRGVGRSLTASRPTRYIASQETPMRTPASHRVEPATDAP
jgi:hypothetical protein